MANKPKVETEVDAREGANTSAIVAFDQKQGLSLSDGKLTGFYLAGTEYEIDQQLTRLPIKQEDRKPFFVKFNSNPYLAPLIEGVPRSKMGQPTIADVTNLETGEQQILIFRTVLSNELKRWEASTGEKLLGHSFAIRPQQKYDADEENFYWIYVIYHLKPKG